MLGISPATGSQTHMSKRARNAGIDWSHFTGKPSVPSSKKRPIEDYFSNKYGIKSDTLKRRLIHEGFKKASCERCAATEWLDGPVPLELDHKNGDHWDNSLENLEILCPNCHAVKTSLQARGIDKIKHHKGERVKPRVCVCGRSISQKAKTCIFCRRNNMRHKIQWPIEQDLLKLLDRFSCVAVGKQLGVSDNAIRKHLHRIAKRRSGVAATHLISGFDDRPVLQSLGDSAARAANRLENDAVVLSHESSNLLSPAKFIGVV